MITLTALMVVSYILQAMGMQEIAARRGIKNPWMAWVPVAYFWTLGAISDDYREKMGANRRKMGMWIIIVYAISMAIMVVIDIFYYICLFVGLVVWPMLIVAFLLLIPMFVVGWAYYVPYYMAMYDLYKSCKPDKTILYLLLSIFLPIGSLFVFLCRNSDEGMPAEELPEYDVDEEAVPV